MMLASMAAAVVMLVLVRGQAIDFGFAGTCASRDLGFGTCVTPDKCQQANAERTRSCNGQVCCPRNQLILTTTAAPDDSETFQQLVQDCGRVQPSRIVFGRSIRSAGRLRKIGRNIPVTAVVGGVPATPSKWPWMALLGERREGGTRWTCGGTLIAPSTVLTAAHCVNGRQPPQLVVRLGEYNISHTRDGRHQDLGVSRVVLHPAYRRSQNDVALLLLSRPAALGVRVQPACLPPPDADHTGQEADLAGWGRVQFAGSVPEALQEVRLQVVDPAQCERNYREAPSFDTLFLGGFQGTKVCANGRDGTSKDACQGDSGGPLVIQGADDRYQVIGVVSTGLGCGNPKYPGIYTKVSKYIPWIVDNSQRQ
ncbi:venom protease-like [Pollicipes pollicipes]|uniref:venom protease-like n=1 Tax=Pollicipes pollicipes TaxID=41117 RepID=UPI00188498E4|nr:venom protease-like [Pollicipes pollicipes]